MTNDVGSHEMKLMIKAFSDKQLIEKINDLLTYGFEAEDQWSIHGITYKDWYGELVYEATERGIDPELTKPIK
jgi:hypothetical protein